MPALAALPADVLDALTVTMVSDVRDVVARALEPAVANAASDAA